MGVLAYENPLWWYLISTLIVYIPKSVGTGRAHEHILDFAVHIHSNMLRKLDFGIYTGVLISILEILINIYIFYQYIFGIL